MRTGLSLILSIVLLAACATPAEQAAQAEREAERMMIIYGPACNRLGYQSNTDVWRDCVLRMSTKDEIARSASYPPYPFYYPYYAGWRHPY